MKGVPPIGFDPHLGHELDQEWMSHRHRGDQRFKQIIELPRIGAGFEHHRIGVSMAVAEERRSCYPGCGKQTGTPKGCVASGPVVFTLRCTSSSRCLTARRFRLPERATRPSSYRCVNIRSPKRRTSAFFAGLMFCPLGGLSDGDDAALCGPGCSQAVCHGGSH